MNPEFAFPDQPAASEIDGSRIRIDHDAIARKVMAAPAALRDDENFLWKLIASIRALVARIFNAILPSTSTGSAVAGAAAAAASVPKGIARDDEHEIVTEPLPKSAVEPVLQSINGLVDRALGVDLAPSVQAALSLPETDRKTTFRVLLQSNLDDTAACQKERDSQLAAVEQLVIPFAAQHRMEPAAALRILRADLNNVTDGKGGGELARLIDPDGKLRAPVAELGRLETALGALARSRGLLCEHALAMKAFERAELADFLRTQGHDASFLANAPSQDNETREASAKEVDPAAPAGSLWTFLGIAEPEVVPDWPQGHDGPSSATKIEPAPLATVADVIADEAELGDTNPLAWGSELSLYAVCGSSLYPDMTGSQSTEKTVHIYEATSEDYARECFWSEMMAEHDPISYLDTVARHGDHCEVSSITHLGKVPMTAVVHHHADSMDVSKASVEEGPATRPRLRLV
jgi:hypothetical protein